MNMEDLMRLAATFWIQSFVVLGAGLCGAHWLRRRNALSQMAALRATLLGVVLCAVVSVVAASRVESRWNVAMPPPSFTPTFAAPFVRSTASVDTPESIATTQTQVLPTQITPTPDTVSTEATVAIVEEPTPLVTWARVYQSAVTVWIFGSALWLSWLAMCALRLAQIRRSSTRCVSGAWHDELELLCGSHHWRRPLLLQGNVQSPLLMSLFRPAIVLPRDDQFDQASRRAVLLHEMTHLRRRDLWWMLATRLLWALLWPQPLLWILARQLERVAEDVCDEAVVRGGCDKRDYARCLLDLSERLTMRADERTWAAGVVPRQSSLGARVRRILSETRGASHVSRSVRALIALATMGAIALAVFLIGIRKRLDAQTIVAAPLLASTQWSESPLEKRVPFQVQSQTVGGITIRVLDARWQIPEWKRVNEASGSNDFQKELKVRYETVRGDSKARVTYENQMSEYATEVHTSDENGSKVTPHSKEHGLATAVSFNSIDPRRTSIPLEFEVLDSAAPPTAKGEFNETIEFKNVPFPQKRDQVLRIGRVLTTAQGTRVFLKAIAVASRYKGYQMFGITDRVLVSMRTLPPAKTPDMNAYLQFDSTDGANGFRGVSGEKLVKDYGNGMRGTDMLEGSDNAVTLFLDALPNLKARRVNIRIYVSEEAASLKQKKWFQRVRFQLPQNQISLGNTKSQRPLAIADADDMRVTLEPLQRFDNDYKTNLYIVNKSGTNWDWKATSLTINDGAERSLDRDSKIAYWKQNGRAVAAEEKCLPIEFDTFGLETKGKPAPKSLEMRFELEAEKRQARVINFRNLPIPRGKQSLSVNRTVKFASGAQFTIRKIESGTFNDRQQRIQSNEQPTKIAITYDTNAQADSDRWVEYEKSNGVDNLGHELRTNDVSQSGQTLYFVPPPRGAKSFDLRLLLAEVTRGPSKTVVFHSLPTPTVKPKAKPQAK